MATANMEDVLYWCVNMGCDFKEPVFPPPGGWMWAEGSNDDLILVPVFTVPDEDTKFSNGRFHYDFAKYKGEVLKEVVDEFRKTLPTFYTQDQAQAWMDKHHEEVTAGTIMPPSGWVIVNKDNERCLQSVPSNIGKGVYVRHAHA